MHSEVNVGYFKVNSVIRTGALKSTSPRSKSTVMGGSPKRIRRTTTASPNLWPFMRQPRRAPWRMHSRDREILMETEHLAGRPISGQVGTVCPKNTD